MKKRGLRVSRKKTEYQRHDYGMEVRQKGNKGFYGLFNKNFSDFT